MLFCLFGFLKTWLYHGRLPRLRSDKFKCCHKRDRAGRERTVTAGGKEKEREIDRLIESEREKKEKRERER